MRIVADENIPYGEEAFTTLGKVETVPGRAITPELVRDADLLIVRSITQVDATLIEGASLRFVGTCTIGEDHIDKALLAARGIGYASAPGCNANSVAEYIVSALIALADRHVLDLASLSLGIVGVGNVGSKVQQKAEALGMTCVLNDPPLASSTGDPKYRPIEAICGCDIVTLHVPLTKEGPHATHHLVDDPFLARMGPETILINSSRGPVVHGGDLEAALERGSLKGCVLDVWEDEPVIDSNLLELVDLGTPHIAGYSFDGKVNGTMQIYEAACKHLGVSPTFDVRPLLPPPKQARITVYADELNALAQTVRAVYDIRRDDADMRSRLLSATPDEQPIAFDHLRKTYPVRREFFNTTVELAAPDARMEQKLAGIGFTIATPTPPVTGGM